MRKIIISVTSDIGLSLAKKWLKEGHDVIGTYRSRVVELDKLIQDGLKVVHCELADNKSIDLSCQQLENFGYWDCAVICPGSMKPIGRFEEIDINKWSESININFTAQLRVLHNILPMCKRDDSSVIFFAGGGTNSAPVNFSAYTASKIALIKMCELLDAETEDCKFSIIGPGWVKTKIHQETLTAEGAGEDAVQRTREHYSKGEWTSMLSIAECCEWIIRSSKSVVGGRNFSVVHDEWGEENLENTLSGNQDFYKLRRYGNNV